MTLHRYLRLLLAALVGLRLVTLVTSPITDNTESRYAEMARKMVETGDWITPQFEYGQPYWGKPPLAMWLSAAGIALFGNHEFGARIFIYLTALAVVWLVAAAVRRETDATTGLAAAVILLGMPLFFYCSAVVMTDLGLTAGTTLVMIAFRRALLAGGARVRGLAVFAGLAIGLLAKGPLALVIALPPLAAWAILTGQVRRSMRRMPWLGGGILLLATVLPWYITAEIRTPGFLRYFLIGEHWQRFTEAGWPGDLYGHAHPEPPGTIWWFTLALTFPWWLGALAAPVSRWRRAWADDGRVLYFALWAAWPLIFFTAARNIVPSYPLPALPAIAVLLAGLVQSGADGRVAMRRLHPLHPALVATCLTIVLAYGVMTRFAPERVPKKTEKRLVRIFEDNFEDGDELCYYGKRRCSAEFYSDGQAANERTPEALLVHLEAPGRLFLAIPPQAFARLPEGVRRRFVRLTARGGGKQVDLYQEREPAALMTAISPIGG